jgi:hypothetical protein
MADTTTTAWTLKYGATEKTFAAWGFTNPMTFDSQQQAVQFTVRVPGAANLVNEPPIPFLGQVTIYRDRTVGQGRDGFTFSGGEIVFQGRQVTDRKTANQSPAETLTFADAWWDLERITFQQQWQFMQVDVITGAATTLAPSYFSRVVLFQKFATPWVLQHNGDQIKEILNWAITVGGVNLQVGTIEPAVYLHVYPCRGIKCAAAIQICLKPCPDAIVEIDPTTTPPTFNVRLRANAPAQSLPYADGLTHASSEIVARPDLIASDVVLQYQKSVSSDGQVQNASATDAYPPGSIGAGVQSVVAAIDLRGSQRTDVMVSAVPFDPTSLAWWCAKKPELARTQVVGGVNQPVYSGLALVPGSVRVTDSAGAVWALPGPLAVLPNELAGGDVCAWMALANGTPVSCQEVAISGQFTYTELDPKGRPRRVVKQDASSAGHTFSVRVKVTNSPAGRVPYLQFYDPGEAPISWLSGGAVVTLAQYIWQSLQWLQHEGSHVIVEKNAAGVPEVSTRWSTRYTLNLTGGKAEWADMAATVQSVVIDWMHGRTEITFGPAKHLAPGDLHELLEFYRWRVVVDRPAQRVTGSTSGAGGQIGGATASENTTAGNAPTSRVVFSAPVAS